METQHAEDDPVLGKYLNNLAGLLENTHCSAEAEPLYVRALQIMLDSYVADHSNYQTVKANYDRFLQRKAKSD
jgi:hypothetical protein